MNHTAVDLYCLIATKGTPYRRLLLREALDSIDEAARYSGDTVSVHVSGTVLPEQTYSCATVTYYPQERQLSQFQHLHYILERLTSVPDDAWIMFHDDDDLSLPHRVAVFKRTITEHPSADTFRSRLALVTMTSDEYTVKTDTATIFTRFWCLRQFFRDFTGDLSDRTVDTLFGAMYSKVHTDKADTESPSNTDVGAHSLYVQDVLYVARSRGHFSEQDWYRCLSHDGAPFYKNLRGAIGKLCAALMDPMTDE